MKLICPTDDLSKALQTVLRSVGARAGIPALSGVLMELTDTELSLTTTDLELTTRVKLPISGEAGKVVVPARYLSEIVRNIPTDEVEIVTEDSTVRISGGRARYNLRSLDAQDFPRMQSGDETTTFTVPADVLSRSLSQVAIAASRDETRPVLTGVLFEADSTDFRIVATDSYRLAVRTIPVSGITAMKILVPARAVVEVARLASSGDVTIEVGASQVGFEIGNTLISSRLIEGEFPPYRQLLPTDQPNVLSVDKAAFTERLKAAAVLAQDATPVYVELEGDRVRLQCQSQGVGEAVEELDADYAGDTLRIAFNPTYLEAGISAVDDDQVKILLSDSQRPVIIRGAAEDYVYLLMPIRLNVS